MRFAIATAFLAACASAVEMKACSGTNMGGSCATKTSTGSRSGRWNSYNFRASRNRCVRVCKDCDSLGYRCRTYSNNNIEFNKFIIFDWADGDGPESTTCC
ncbi:hypothetical protein MY11210_006009 [Beauveria gryllotalpidicola]